MLNWSLIAEWKFSSSRLAIKLDDNRWRSIHKYHTGRAIILLKILF